MATRAIFLVALVSLLFIGILHADDAPILSGSKTATKDALTLSDAVFVGELIQLGEPGPEARSICVNLLGSDVKVLRVLRGSVEGHILVSMTYIPSEYEEPPVVGRTYIFFVLKPTQGRGSQFCVIKLLPATDDNISKIKDLISN